MAIVILCGLLSSTFLNMLVVPTLFLRFGKSVEAELPTDVGIDVHGELSGTEHALPAAPM